MYDMVTINLYMTAKNEEAEQNAAVPAGFDTVSPVAEEIFMREKPVTVLEISNYNRCYCQLFTGCQKKLGITDGKIYRLNVNPDEMRDDDLFARDFIYSLAPPTNYIGAESIFGEEPNFTEVLDKDVRESLTGGKCCCGKNKSCGEKVAEPIKTYRAGMAFEELRMKTESSGKQPMAFMLTFGSLAMCRARAQFSSNFFACAGIKVVDNNRFSSIEDGVKAAIEAKADIVVACSSDDEYAEAVPQIAEKLGSKAILVVAGEPASKADLESKGIKNFISARSNVLETLQQYQKELGI